MTSPIRAGSRFGRFEVLGALGQGAMGSVLRARDTASGREVALKLLGDHASSTSLERFRREAELTAGFDHPGIVRTHDAGVEEGQPFIVYELIEGARTLDQVLPGLDVRARCELVRQGAEALGYAHAAGVVHRDVKPGNLLVDSAGKVRVVDFGIASAVGLEKLTVTGALVGTPEFMAPEQVLGERGGIGPPTDVWALGVLLYLCLTGDLPFEGGSLVELSVAIASSHVEAPRDIDPDLDVGLEAVCLRAIQRASAQRYPDAGAFAADLGRALEGRPTEAQRLRWRRTAGVLGLGAALMALVVVGAVLAFGPPEDPSALGREETPASDPTVEPPGLEEPGQEVGLQPVYAPPPRVEDLDPGLYEDPYLSMLRGVADQGNPEAMVDLGDALGDLIEDRPEVVAHALAWYERAGELGDVEGMRRASDIYIEVPHPYDPARGPMWLERAVAKGDLVALMVMGDRLREGTGFPQDPERAVGFYARAAEQGGKTAHSRLGEMYRSGLGVERDLARAVELWRKGAELGSTGCMSNLGRQLVQHGTTAAEIDEGVGWLRRAVQQGDGRATNELALLHMAGRGVPRDRAEARRLFSLGVQQDDTVAMAGLARLLVTGPEAEREPEQARRLMSLVFARTPDAGTVALLAATPDLREPSVELRSYLALAARQGVEGASKLLEEVGGAR